jgi:N-acetylgalactosamine kinase
MPDDVSGFASAGGDAQRRARAALCIERFEAHFGRPPQVIAWAPGRVNVIGEHTDYNGLPVLPMAIERGILVAGATRADKQFYLANADPRFAPRSYELAPQLARGRAGDWANYHKAAALGVMSACGGAAMHGGDFFVDGNLPAGGGLSSSAALVVASALACLELHESAVRPLELASILAAAERFVGTQSGGMDQAVCLLGQAGAALRIDFDPLRTCPVPVPPGAAFVVCHSLVTAEKSGAAQAAYNRRVAECRLACRVLERLLGASLPRPLERLGDLARMFPDRPLSEFVEVLESGLPPRPLDLREVAERIGAPIEGLALEIGAKPRSRDKYALLQRARHVLTEAERVDRAEAALRDGDWAVLSAVMTASHTSCRDDYEVSCAEIEALVEAAKEAGALGARLTGAGFGGCTINLVETAQVSLFCAMIERSFYKRRGGGFPDHCIVVTPSGGASVMRL